MIDHSQCEHERTSGARARCRRASADGPAKPRKKATPKEVDLSSGGEKASTPGWAADECHVCGIERSEFQGTDAFTGMFVLVGQRCVWRVKRADDFAAMSARR